jgi:hypothetical protein
MLETEAREYLERNQAGPAVLDALLSDGLVARVPHLGHVFVLRGRAPRDLDIMGAPKR